MDNPQLVTAVILAAGAGTRLGALGRQYSKPMVPVAGQPLIAWLIADLQRAGARIVVVGHPSDSQLATFLRTTHPDIPLALQVERLGIADALRFAASFVAEEPGYLACACDSLFQPADLARLIALGRENPHGAIVGVLDMGAAATASRSAVRIAGDWVVEIVEKPPAGTIASTLVAMPLYWLPAAFRPYLARVPPLGREHYVSTALNTFIQAGGRVRAFPIQERIEVTTPADVDDAARRLQQRLAR